MRHEIEKIFAEVYLRETEGASVPELTDDLVLLDTELDSLGFAILVVELEGALGFDPFTLAQDAYYPTTFGEFVTFYENNKP